MELLACFKEDGGKHIDDDDDDGAHHRIASKSEELWYFQKIVVESKNAVYIARI